MAFVIGSLSIGLLAVSITTISMISDISKLQQKVRELEHKMEENKND